MIREAGLLLRSRHLGVALAANRQGPGSCLVAQNFRFTDILLTFLFIFQKEKFCCVKFVVLLIFFMKSDRFVISRRLATVRVAVVSK